MLKIIFPFPFRVRLNCCVIYNENVDDNNGDDDILEALGRFRDCVV